jgi:hypothetical protein
LWQGSPKKRVVDSFLQQRSNAKMSPIMRLRQSRKIPTRATDPSEMGKQLMGLTDAKIDIKNEQYLSEEYEPESKTDRKVSKQMVNFKVVG